MELLLVIGAAALALAFLVVSGLLVAVVIAVAATAMVRPAGPRAPRIEGPVHLRRKLAAELGLEIDTIDEPVEEEPSRILRLARMRGVRDGVTVTVTDLPTPFRRRPARFDLGTALTLSPGPSGPTVEVRRKQFATLFHNPTQVQEGFRAPETGDTTFDATWVIKGDGALLSDPLARALARELALEADSVTLGHAEVRVLHAYTALRDTRRPCEYFTDSRVRWQLQRAVGAIGTWSAMAATVSPPPP